MIGLLVAVTSGEMQRRRASCCGARSPSFAATIIAATLAAWLASKTPENVRAWIGNADNHMLVADEGGTILGIGGMQRSGRISLNYVSPGARFRGVSKALMRRLEARALELGLATSTLESTETARQFYRSIGYSEAGASTPGFGVGICYPMVKALASPP
jgi:GNAT superfamily N-acetyltransferase